MADLGIKTYPNPVDNTVFLEIPDGVAGDLSIDILDQAGKEIKRDVALSGQGNTRKINTENLNSAMYLMKISLNEKFLSVFHFVKK